MSDLDRAHARRDDPATSKSAAAAMTPKAVTALEYEVVKTLADSGPLTAWQISQRGGLEYGSTSPRLKNMEKKGLVRRLAPESREGRRASIVWELINDGR